MVTGCSTGIGRAVVRRLGEAGYDVYAGVRTEEDADSLRATAGAIPAILDVRSEGDIDLVYHTILRDTGGRLDVLVNNAGVGVAGPLETYDLELLRTQLEVNAVGALAVTQAMLPLLRETRGRVVNVSSVAGGLAYPFMGPYSASKHALEALSDALRRELRPWGVRVCVVQPGAVRTPILIKAALGCSGSGRLTDSLYGEALQAVGRFFQHVPTIPPRAVAEVVARAATSRRPKTRYRVGLDAKVALWAARVLPDLVLDGLVRRQLGTP